jgi:hypothetical protein
MEEPTRAALVRYTDAALFFTRVALGTGQAVVRSITITAVT